MDPIKQFAKKKKNETKRIGESNTNNKNLVRWTQTYQEMLGGARGVMVIVAELDTATRVHILD